MAKLDLLPIEALKDAAECLKVMAHPLRLRIVDILMQGEYPVNEIARLCKLSPHQTCEHLRMLKRQGLLGSDRRGRSVYYKISSRRLPQILHCVRSTCRVKSF
jgi:ArsR family transcriptional regulator, zinc-responsive transcriptional repressor